MNILNSLKIKLFNKFSFIILLIIGIIYTFFLRESISASIIWFIDSLLKNIVLICAINTIISFSSLYLNKDNSLLKYLNKSAFAVYIIHQPILLTVAFIVVPLIKVTTVSMLLIILISLVLTFLALICYIFNLHCFIVRSLFYSNDKNCCKIIVFIIKCTYKVVIL